MEQDGPRIGAIPAEEFRGFAKRYAHSPGIGPIQTSLDGGIDQPDDYERVLVGLWGCGTHCGGRLVSVLEGGYDPEAVATAGAAHVGALMRH